MDGTLAEEAGERRPETVAQARGRPVIRDDGGEAAISRETPTALPDGLHPAHGMSEQMVAPALAELVRRALGPQDGGQGMIFSR